TGAAWVTVHDTAGMVISGVWIAGPVRRRVRCTAGLGVRRAAGLGRVWCTAGLGRVRCATGFGRRRVRGSRLGHWVVTGLRATLAGPAGTGLGAAPGRCLRRSAATAAPTSTLA